MGERWIAEAEDLKAAGASGVMEGGTPRVTLHVTVSKPGTFDAMHGVLTRAQAEPHILYDPATDRMGQYFPLDRSARALRNDGTRRTNGHGTVNIQVEVCALPVPAFTDVWKPGPNWVALLRAIRSWGVPDVWPAGRLAVNGSDNVDRSWGSYSKAGWFGHCNVPGNDHWDPGPINQRAVFSTPNLAPVEDDMPTPDDLWNATLVGPDGKFKARARDWLTYANDKAGNAARDAGAALAVVKALAAKPQGLTAQEIEDAAAAGAKAALEERIQSATTVLNVAPRETP